MCIRFSKVFPWLVVAITTVIISICEATNSINFDKILKKRKQLTQSYLDKMLQQRWKYSEWTHGRYKSDHPGRDSEKDGTNKTTETH